MSKVTIRFTCNEGEALAKALRYATAPANTAHWARKPRHQRYAESAVSKVLEALMRAEMQG